MYRLRLKRPSPSLGEPWGCPPFKSSTRLGELAALAVAASFREAHWDVLLHPTKNGGVGQGNAPFGHHPDQVTGAQLEGQVPPHAEHDDLPVKVPPLEKILRRRPFDHPGVTAAYRPFQAFAPEPFGGPLLLRCGGSW
jgi:hypothetical protein